MQHRLCLAGRGGQQLLHRQVAGGPGKVHALGQRRELLQQLAQAPLGFLHLRPLTGCANDLVDGRQGAAQQDGAGNHHARRHLVFQHQPGPQAQGQRLHRHAQRLAPALDLRHARAGQVLLAHVGQVLLGPAAAQVGQHAHTGNHLGIAQVGPGIAAGIDRQFPCFFQVRAADPFVDPAHQHQERRAAQGEPAQRRVEIEHHQHIHREPRRIEQRE